MLSYADSNAQPFKEKALATAAPATNHRRRKLYWLLLAIGLALLAILIGKIGPTRMLSAWRQAEKQYLAAAACLFTLAVLVRAIKWRLFLGATPHPIGYLSALRGYVLNAFFANLTPARTGEIFAPVWLGRHGVPTATGYAVVVVDRMLDVLAVLALFAGAVWMLGRQATTASSAYETAGILVGVCVLIGLALLIFVLLRLDLAIGYLARFHGRIAGKIRNALESFRQALVPFKNRNVLVANLLLTFATWLMDLTTSFLVVRSVLPGLNWPDSATASMFATAAALASMIPGGIGVGAMGYTAVLAILGFDATLAGAGAVLMTVLTHLIRASLAGLLTWTQPKTQ